MTREDAIEILAHRLDMAQGERDAVTRHMIELEQEAGRLRAELDAAISALRQQEHFREATKKVEPLTLDELRKMDGDVWVCYPQPTFGTNLLTEHMDCTRYKFSFADYGKSWMAYRQKPDEDKHEDY